MLAAYNGNLETASMLLRYKADVVRRNDHGQTPLGGVAFKGNLPLAGLLLDAGADVDADNGGGKTPLMFAVMFGHREVVHLFIRGRRRPGFTELLGISAQKIASFTGALRSLSSNAIR